MRKIRIKRIALYIAATALLLLGDRGVDIGQLRPVEVVQLYEKGGLLFLKTDTGDAGWGLTVDGAIAKLKKTTPGRIYLDTADYLLLEVGTEEYADSLKPYLKKRTAMVYGPEEMDLQAAAGYLRIHRPSARVKNGQNPAETLSIEGGKIILKKFKEK